MKPSLEIIDSTQVALAYLQTATRIDGIGGGITTLNSGARPGVHNCQKIEVSDNGLLVTGDGITSLIPWANVKVATLK